MVPSPEFVPDVCKTTEYKDGRTRKRPCSQMCDYMLRTEDTEHLINKECIDGCYDCYSKYLIHLKKRKLTTPALEPTVTTVITPPTFFEEIPESTSPTKSLTDGQTAAAIGCPIGFLLLLLLAMAFIIARKKGFRFRKPYRRVRRQEQNGVPLQNGLHPAENGIGNGVNGVTHNGVFTCPPVSQNGNGAILGRPTPIDRTALANAVPVEVIRHPIPATDEADGIPPVAVPAAPLPPPAAPIPPQADPLPAQAQDAPTAAAEGSNRPHQVDDQDNPPKDSFGDGSFRN